MLDLLILGGTLYDGTGAPPQKTDIGIENGKIRILGELSNYTAHTVIHADGLDITPGFIDMHSHADCSVPMWPDMENLLGQGITTCFSGHCGFGLVPVEKYWLEMDFEQEALNKVMPENIGGPCPDPLRSVYTSEFAPVFEETFHTPLDWGDYSSYVNHLKSSGIGCNMSFNIGHHQLRQEAMGFHCNRKPTEEELCTMELLLEDAMKSGAWGLSIGLDYQPGTYADTKELQRLFQIVARYHGVVTAHAQMKGRRGDDVDDTHLAMDGYREFMELGKSVGVHIHISHLMNGYLGRITEENAVQYAHETIDLIRSYQKQGVNVTWDTLPHSTIAMFHFPQLANLMRPYLDRCGGIHKFVQSLISTNYGELIIQDILRGDHLSKSPFTRISPQQNPEWDKNILIEVCAEKSYEHKTLRQLAEEHQTDSLHMLLNILIADPDTLYSKLKKFDSDSYYVFEQEADACFGTDNGCCNYGILYREGTDFPWYQSTPSAFCGMIRLIEDTHLESFEQLIFRMTGNAAKSAGYLDRGIIKPGNAADILIINRKHLKSNFSETAPQTPPEGLDYVIVNGKIAVDHGTHTHIRSGQIIERPQHSL